MNIYICSNTYYSALKIIEKGASGNVNNIIWFTDKKYRKLAGSHMLDILWMRLGMYIFYPIWLSLNVLLAPKKSIFVVTTNTFYAPCLVQLIARLKCHKVIHLLYDLYPDALQIANKIQVSSVVSKLIGNITKYILKNCDVTVFLGSFLKDHTEKRWGKARCATVIDVGANTKQFPSIIHNIDSKNKIMIRYGGQLGYMHNAELLADCVLNAVEIFREKVEFHFYASGLGYKAIYEQLQGHKGIILSSPRQEENWQQSMSQFQLGMVSLSPGGATVCLPNKIYGIMASGQAVLAICPIWSDLGQIVIQNQAGWVIQNSMHDKILNIPEYEYLQRVQDVRDTKEIIQDFCNAIDQCLLRPDILIEKKYNARKAALEKYDEPILAQKWASILN